MKNELKIALNVEVMFRVNLLKQSNILNGKCGIIRQIIYKDDPNENPKSNPE